MTQPRDDMAEQLGHSLGSSARAGAIRWSRRGRWLDLLVAAASLAIYTATGSTCWLWSMLFSLALWVVDLWAYRKLTRPGAR